MNLKECLELMRAAGIRRLVVSSGISLDDGIVTEVELFDTIPAPPELALIDGEPEPENKGPGTCIALGCVENNGWQFDTRYCPAHGRFAAGVKP